MSDQEGVSQSTLFNNVFSIAAKNTEFEFRYPRFIPQVNFSLNPRRLRGSDFLIRWSQGVWSEKRILAAINETPFYFALPYGPSRVAPHDPEEVERYFRSLEEAGLGKQKRPDLLVFRKSDKKIIERIISGLGGKQNLPFMDEEKEPLKQVILRALSAIECENSLWEAKKMPDYGKGLRPMRRLKNKPGLPKNAVVPTVILKDEDRNPLGRWEEQNNVDIHIWHLFYDLAFGISLNSAEKLIHEGLIEAKLQKFHAPSGATTTKYIYNIYYHYTYSVGKTLKYPKLVADYITNKNGHILPYVKFEEGQLKIDLKALEVLNKAYLQKGLYARG